MISVLLNCLVSPVMFGGMTVGGIIVLAFVWEKIRPVVIVKSKKGGKFFFGITHSCKRKNMKKFTKEGVTGINIGDDTCYGLANTPNQILKKIGTINEQKAQELLNNIEEKKVKKIEKRSKKQ